MRAQCYSPPGQPDWVTEVHTPPCPHPRGASLAADERIQGSLRSVPVEYNYFNCDTLNDSHDIGIGEYDRIL